MKLVMGEFIPIDGVNLESVHIGKNAIVLTWLDGEALMIRPSVECELIAHKCIAEAELEFQLR